MTDEKRAFVFPGQGAQKIGMGIELAQAFSASMLVFEEVDDALGEKLSDAIWHGNEESLMLTRNAQPALMATSIAALRALDAESAAIDSVDYLAGHSLGEYSAFCAAGSISLADTARLLRIRGDAMQTAVSPGSGAMAALLGLDLESAIAVAKDAARDDICETANDNDPKQLVVSGHRGAVERAVELARSRGAKRAVMLPVSAPFHCSLMEPAKAAMIEALDRVEIRHPVVPVVANVNARPVSDPAEIRKSLVEQITCRVRWRESVEWLRAEGVTQIYELGIGAALSGMARRIDRSLSCIAVNDAASVKAAAAKMRNFDGDV